MQEHWIELVLPHFSRDIEDTFLKFLRLDSHLCFLANSIGSRMVHVITHLLSKLLIMMMVHGGEQFTPVAFRYSVGADV